MTAQVTDWKASVEKYAPADHRPFWRGFVTAPWPAGSNRMGNRRRGCDHRHQSEKNALKCAERWRARLRRKERNTR